MIVLPVLTFGSIIWSPYSQRHIYTLESMQRQFLRFLSFKAGHPISFYDHDLTNISVKFNLPTLKSLHDYYDVLFVFKVLSGCI